jgi:hypothetical protein
MSRKHYPSIKHMTPEQVAALECGAIVELPMGLGERLLLRKTRDGRLCPVRGAGLSAGAAWELGQVYSL